MALANKRIDHFTGEKHVNLDVSSFEENYKMKVGEGWRVDARLGPSAPP